MNPLASALVLAGSVTAVLAGIGLLRFETSYARFHAAGKASPVAFLLVAAGAGVEIGWSGAAEMAVAGAALILTLPVGVHLLFRAVHRTTPRGRLDIDELAPVEDRKHRRGETR
ncbi:MAG: monovalent cation/H(+) antiporter subunit G [Acidimicrobiia bacterium]|nr:monovalent cation/H(+) antiporter subunit G [Acidimicrobiia bacterium]